MTADLERCKAILSFKRGYIIDDGQPTSRLRARALLNKRLELAFGIDNAFTTTEKKYHNEFLSESQRGLNIGNGDWSRLSQWARPFARARIAREKETCNIVTVIQMMTLNMALQIFLKRDDSSLLDDDLAQLASEINRLWINSKSPDTIQPWAEQEQLHRILRNLTPESHHDPCSPRENPMNLILPSYETLWRVVLRCFLELNFRPRHAAHAPRWRAAVRFFMENVGGWHMDNRMVNGISATDVAKEALRLYPPTRRVYRTTHSGRSVAADIETLHRDPAVWPGDGEARATNFCPERWMEDGVNQDAFLAFGAGPFACPARGGFGPKAVALLVGALTEAVEVKDERGRGWVVDGRFADVMAAEEPLGSGREAFDGLRLRRGGGGSEKSA